jgi:hypothetical protein
MGVGTQQVVTARGQGAAGNLGQTGNLKILTNWFLNVQTTFLERTKSPTTPSFVTVSSKS